MFISPTTSSRLHSLFLRNILAIKQGFHTTCQRKRSPLPHFSAMAGRNEQQIVRDVFTHWYGSETIGRFDTLEHQYSLWYGGTKEIDDDIRERFGKDVEHALNGGWDQLIGGSEHPISGELALVILLDQYTRNIFRGTARAFAGDKKAAQVAASIVSTDRWEEAKETLAVTQCSSFLLPFMHQESLHHLDVCVEKASDLIKHAERAGEDNKDIADAMQKMLEFSNKHRDIIVQFGRYPHRNEVLGRESSPEELEFLKEGMRFGQ